MQTDLGHFLVRLSEKVEPAYRPFEEVELEIGVELAKQRADELADLIAREEHRIEMFIESREDAALYTAYRRDSMTNLDLVSDLEAEQWWDANKRDFLAFVNASEGAALFPTPEEELAFKKRNALSARLQETVDRLYASSDIRVFDHLFNY